MKCACTEEKDNLHSSLFCSCFPVSELGMNCLTNLNIYIYTHTQICISMYMQRLLCVHQNSHACCRGKDIIPFPHKGHAWQSCNKRQCSNRKASQIYLTTFCVMQEPPEVKIQRAREKWCIFMLNLKKEVDSCGETWLDKKGLI